MVRGTVVQQPPVLLFGRGLCGIRPVVCRTVGQHIPEHVFAPSLAVSLARLHDVVPPTA
jgi:hypothetical protein